MRAHVNVQGTDMSLKRFVYTTEALQALGAQATGHDHQCPVNAVGAGRAIADEIAGEMIETGAELEDVKYVHATPETIEFGVDLPSSGATVGYSKKFAAAWDQIFNSEN